MRHRKGMVDMEHSSKLAPEDEAAIRALLGRMGQAWVRGDGEADASVFSEDATDDNAPGQRVVGRQQIATSHQRVYGSVLNHTRLGGGDPVRLQPVAPDVVVVHASGAVLFAGEDEAKVPPNGLLTMVAARRGDRWQFVSFSNTPTGRGRNVRFLWRFLVSRFATRRAGHQGTALHAGGQATEDVAMDPRPPQDVNLVVALDQLVSRRCRDRGPCGER